MQRARTWWGGALVICGLSGACTGAVEGEPTSNIGRRGEDLVALHTAELGEAVMGPVSHSQRAPAPALGNGLFGVTWAGGFGGTWFTRLSPEGKPLDTRSLELSPTVGVRLGLYGTTRTTFDGKNFHSFWLAGNASYTAVVSPAGELVGSTRELGEYNEEYDAASSRENGLTVYAFCDGERRTRALRLDGENHPLDAEAVIVSAANTCDWVKVAAHAGRFYVLTAQRELEGQAALHIRALSGDGSLGPSEEIGEGGLPDVQVASNGSTLLLLWGSEQQRYVRRIDAQGAWLDSDARPLSLPASFVSRLVSHGSSFAALGNAGTKTSVWMLNAQGELEGDATMLQPALLPPLEECEMASGPEGLLLTGTASLYDAHGFDNEGDISAMYAWLLEADGTLSEARFAAPRLAQQRFPVQAWDGARHRVAWVDTREGFERLAIHTRSVSEQGKALGDSSVRAVDLAGKRALGTAMAALPDTQLVAWEEHSAHAYWGNHAIGYALLRDGEPAVVGRVGGGKVDARYPTVATNGETYFLAWSQYDQDVSAGGLKGLVIDPKGAPAQAQPLTLFTETHGSRSPSKSVVAWVGDHYVLVAPRTRLELMEAGVILFVDGAGAVTDTLWRPYLPYEEGLNLACSPSECMLGARVYAADGEWDTPLRTTFPQGPFAWDGSAFVGVEQDYLADDRARLVRLAEEVEAIGGAQGEQVFETVNAQVAVSSSGRGHTLVTYTAPSGTLMAVALGEQTTEPERDAGGDGAVNDPGDGGVGQTEDDGGEQAEQSEGDGGESVPPVTTPGPDMEGPRDTQTGDGDGTPPSTDNAPVTPMDEAEARGEGTSSGCSVQGGPAGGSLAWLALAMAALFGSRRRATGTRTAD